MIRYPYRPHRSAYRRAPNLISLLMTLLCVWFVIFLGLSLLSGCAVSPEQEQRNADALMYLGQSLQNRHPYYVQPRQTMTTTCAPSSFVGESVRCRSTIR